MPPMETTEGTLDFAIPSIEQPCKTWYTVFGSLSSSKRPLVVLHGGPGMPHYYLLPIADIASRYNMPAVFYDQIGCGNSTRLPEKLGDGEFWTVDLFLSELDNLLTKLGIKDDYNLLGHSWGGMLGACHAVQQPKGLHKLIIANSPADLKMWAKAVDRLRAQLPPDVQEVLTRCERWGTTDSLEYKKAVELYFDRHRCSLNPLPKELKRSFKVFKEDMTVMLTMNGPSQFFITGTLKDWTIIEELHKITVPTLVINGRWDEVQDDVVGPFLDRIPKARWVRLMYSSHSPHLEERQEFMEIVGQFLWL